MEICSRKSTPKPRSSTEISRNFRIRPHKGTTGSIAILMQSAALADKFVEDVPEIAVDTADKQGEGAVATLSAHTHCDSKSRELDSTLQLSSPAPQ